MDLKGRGASALTQITVPAAVDWVAWHSPYSDPHSPLSQRLAIIQSHIRSWLLSRQLFPIQVISLCAGQGRDLLDVLEHMPTQRNLMARLIENDPTNVEVASNRVRELGLLNVEVNCADAGNSDSYVAATPVDLVLLCGVFGNISDHDIFQTIKYLPHLCTAGATVIWTRSRRDPDITPDIRRAFEKVGFREDAFVAPDEVKFSVGVNTFEGQPLPSIPGTQLFTFL